MSGRLIVVLLLATVCVPASSGQQEKQDRAPEKKIISVRDSTGELRGGFEARRLPYRSGARFPLRVALSPQTTGKTSDGRVVNGFAFYGWVDGNQTRVKVFMLIPAPGVENAYVWTEASSADEKLIPKEIAEIMLSEDTPKPILEMKQLGIGPFRLEVGPTMLQK